VNCRNNLPSYGRWQEKFARQGVIVIGVHTPETPWERVTANVTRQIRRLGISYPVLLDPKGENWSRWGQNYWPTVYLVDKHGRLSYRWIGELEYGHAGGEKTMERLVARLLAER
jgi:AhpC/TSA family